MSGVLAYFDERARQLLKQDRYADLKKLSAQALAEDPEHAPALLLHGYSLVQLGSPEGLNLMREAIALQPNNDYFFYIYANALYETGDKVRALTQANKALELSPNNPNYLVFVAQLHANDKMYGLAIKECNQVVHYAPWCVEAVALKAYCLLKQNKKKQAVEFITQALNQDPGNAYVNRMAGIIHSGKKEFRLARQFLGFSLSQDPTDTSGQLNYLLSHRNRFFEFLFGFGTMRVVLRVLWIICIYGMLLLVDNLSRMNEWYDKTSFSFVFRCCYYMFIYMVFYTFQPLVLAWLAKANLRKKMFSMRKQEILYTSAFLVLVLAVTVTDMFVKGFYSLYWLIIVFHAFVLFFSLLIVTGQNSTKMFPLFGYLAVFTLLLVLLEPEIMVLVAGLFSMVTLVVYVRQVEIFFQGSVYLLGIRNNKP